MNLHIYDTIEQHSDEWFNLRLGMVTASTIHKLITAGGKVADNETSRGLALTLAAERITGEVEYIHPTFDMQRGTEDEPIARAVYDEHIAPVEEVGFMTRAFDGFTIGYSPDGVIGDDGLLEIKSRKPKEHIKTILSGKPPAENMAQLMTGLLISGRKWIDYCSFSAGLPLWTVRVYPDADWFAVIEEAASAIETNIADVIDRYTAAVEGLPATERRIEIKDFTF